MFDAFMERTLPLWLLFSALLPMLVAYMLFKAAFRIRQLRALLDEATRKAAEEGVAAPGHPRLTPSRDWVATGPARER